MATTSTPKIFTLSALSFEQMYSTVRTYLINQFQQVGDVFSPASAYGQLLSVILDMGKLIFYYIEDSVTEMNIYTASRDVSIKSLARIAGHNPTRSLSASGTLVLTYSGQRIDMYGNTVIIPNYTKLTNSVTGLPYLIVLNTEETRLELTGKKQVEVKIMQGEIEAQQLTGTGREMQSYSITVKRGYQIDNDFVKLYVNNEAWKVYDSLYDIPYQSKGAVIKSGINGGLDIYFGNSYFGAVPALGSTIRVEYLTNAGNAGNIFDDENPSFNFVDDGYDLAGSSVDLNKALNTRVGLSINFGADSEPVYLTRVLAPKTSRSYVLANANNYTYFLERFNMFSVVDAFNTFDDNNFSDDKVVYLFLIPDVNKRKPSNADYFNTPINLFTLTNDEKTKIYNLVEESGQKILGSVLKIVDPIIKKYVINVQIAAYNGYSKEVIRQQIVSKCSDYFLNNRRRDKIPKSDLVAIIEGVEGVDSVNVWFVSQENEAFKADPANAQKTPVGLDDFGDISIGRGELALIRGGWDDRAGFHYYDSTDSSKPGSINIVFGTDTDLNLNMELHRINVDSIKNN
jgi:hypothetical protein